jgi:hypothetical protein
MIGPEHKSSEKPLKFRGFCSSFGYVIDGGMKNLETLRMCSKRRVSKTCL